MLGLGLIYPIQYEMRQLWLMGITNYASDVNNYTDFLYIWGSIANVVIQNTLGPRNIISQTIMMIIVLQVLMKTFFFLRIFPTLAPIVVMLKTVIYDLRIFMFFYLILITMFC